jgi:D-xylose transport system permease protein
VTSVDKPAASEPQAAVPPPAGIGDTENSELATLASTAPVAGGTRVYVHNYIQRLRGGDMGSLPAITGLIVLAVIFSIAQPSFHSLFNFGNMFTEGTGTIFIAMGLVFVLLLGEIDLAAGYTAGVCAAVMVRLMVGYNWSWWASIPAALVTGVVIGFIVGWLRAKVRIPSFIVTLAFFLAFQGIMLYIVNNGAGQHGDVRITDRVVNAFANEQMPDWAGWMIAALVVIAYAATKVLALLARRRQGLAAEPVGVFGGKIAVLAVISFVLVYLLNQNRALNQTAIPTNVNGHIVFKKPPAVEGVPWAVPVLLVLFVIWTFLLGRTRYGRHVYAVGGNEEAARRAGISVDRIRISVFVLSSFMAAVGGIMIGSNVSSVSVQNYGGNTLLLAVGAAVIGGTSLFGGKGRMIDAIIGGAVVEVIYNGMANLVKGTNSSAIQYIATGLALLLAAAVDALSRRRAGSAGLA